MADLFEPVSRDERQDECIQNWIRSKGKATCVAATGFGFLYLDRKYKLYNFFKNGSRSVEEFTELQSGNIGEKLELESRDYMYENPEINSETKKSESSYSVEGETYDEK